MNENWTSLSRDLQGIPRRVLHDFARPEAERDTPLAKSLAWGLWAVVFVTTVSVYLRFADHRRATGIGAAFLFFGAWLTCYRFMYYDALVSALGFAVLFAEPARFLTTRVFELSLVSRSPSFKLDLPIEPHHATPTTVGSRVLAYVCSFPVTIFALLLLVENSLNGLSLEATFGMGYYSRVTTGPGGATGRSTPRVVADTSSSYPWETGLIMLVWLWCGWRLIRGAERHGD